MIGITNPHARALRQNSTDAERRLWSGLRNRQLGGFKFRRQVTIGRYIADFACVECKIIVEADGGQHSVVSDAERTEYLEQRGWEFLRYRNNDVLQQTDTVLSAILRACEVRRENPSPCPLPRAGEGI